MKKLVLLTVMALAVMTLASHTVEADMLPEGNWTLLPQNSDDFDGNSLDETKWKNGIWYDTTSELAFHPKNVSVRDGNLVLAARSEMYNGKNYTAAAVESRFEIPGTASYVEVRAKALDKNANVLSAIWLQSSPLTWELNPNPEIDIMETFDYSKMTSTLHTWWQKPSIHLQRGHRAWQTGLEDISTDYHTYGLERRNGVLRFYFDGQLTWEKSSWTSSFVELSRHMVLSLEGHLGKPVPEKLPAEFLVDYVHTYYDNFETDIQDGTYYVMNKHSGKYLSFPNTTSNSLQLVQSETKTPWVLTKQTNGTWMIMSPQTHQVVDLTASGGVTSNGTAIIRYYYHGDSNQFWYILPTETGDYKMISYLSGKLLCVKDASLQENAPIVQWSYGNDNADANDEWVLVPSDEIK